MTLLLRRFGVIAWGSRAVLVLIAVFALLHARHYAGVAIDDAFITFRHSLNLLRGYGFTCNPGERLEGTSSTLFGLIILLPLAVGVDPYRAAALLGSLAFAGCTVSAYWAVRACIPGRFSRLLGLGAASLAASSSTLAFHSQTGMETVPYCFLLACGFALHLRAVHRAHAPRAWVLLLAGAALMRPEGVAYFLLFWTAGLLKRSWAVSKRELALFMAVYSVWVFLRFAYFGSVMPNSIIAKGGTMAWYAAVGPGLAARELVRGPGIQLLRAYASTHGPATFLLFGTLLLRPARYAGLLAASCGVLCAGTIAWNGGDWMPHQRLLTPALVPLAVGAGLGLRGFLFHAAQRYARSHAPSLAFVGLALAVAIGTARKPLSRTHAALVDILAARELGRRLTTVTRGDDRVASELAGALPFYWGIPLTDMFGLCDRHIARLGKAQPFGVGRIDPAYVLAAQPTVIVFDHVTRAAFYYGDPAFMRHRQDYYLLRYSSEYEASFTAGVPPVLFIRKDRPDADAVARALEAQLVDAGDELRRRQLTD